MQQAYTKTIVNGFSEHDRNVIAKLNKNYETPLNTVSLTFDTLIGENSETLLQTNCSNCGNFLSTVSKNYITQTKRGLKWKCEMCNKVSMDEISLCNIPNSNPVLYNLDRDKNSKTIIGEENLIESPIDIEEDISIIFCIDISGSMEVKVPSPDMNSHNGGKNGKAFSRLDCVKMAVTSQIKKIEKLNPNAKVGLIFFENTIQVYGDCLRTKQVYEGKILSDHEGILSASQGLKNYFMQTPIKHSSVNIIDSLNKVNPSGSTALGPALLFSLGLINKGKIGSQIIICTDGIANNGLGSLDDKYNNNKENVNENCLEESKTFYTELGKMAQKKRHFYFSDFSCRF